MFLSKVVDLNHCIIVDKIIYDYVSIFSFIASIVILDRVLIFHITLYNYH